MQALSIRQPWAWLIVQGHKDIENRTWHTGFRGKFWIHAGKTMTRKEYEDCAAFLLQVPALVELPPIVLPPMSMLPTGGLVGWASMVGCVKNSASPWFCGPYGFQLQDRGALVGIIPCKGALGFFQPDIGEREV